MRTPKEQFSFLNDSNALITSAANFYEREKEGSKTNSQVIKPDMIQRQEGAHGSHVLRINENFASETFQEKNVLD